PIHQFANCSFLRQFFHIRLQLVILVLHGVEKQAFGQVRAPFAVVHLIDEVVNLLNHVLERALEPATRGDLMVEGFHDGEQVTVELYANAAGGFYRPHRYAPKLLTAVGSSACISMKFCAPVMVSIVSTRFWTPDSLRWPPALCTCRYRSIRQPIVALST